ncbi:unnamed protein product [Cochlearia groenlandica]
MSRQSLLKLATSSSTTTDSSPFSKLLDSCIRSKLSPRSVRGVHAPIVKSPFADEIYIQNRLIDAYAKCGSLEDARQVFDEMPQRNVFTWNTLVTALTKLGFLDEADSLFRTMPERDQCTWNSMVSGFAQHDRIKEARLMFDSLPVRNVVAETSMISGYAMASSIKAARLMFTKMTERNIVSWNALIAGYTQNGENEEALGLFRLLKKESAHVHVLKHGFKFRSGEEEADVFVGNSLIDMYVKCGCVEEGYLVFKKMMERDRVSYNAMIIGFAQNGYGDKALELFKEMLNSGEKPDHITMIGVLSACGHAGFVEEGRRYFTSMEKEFGVVPLRDHYTCMVDLLGRAGLLEEAKSMVEEMPMEPDSVIWGSLLGACKVHRNIVLGVYVAKKFLEVESSYSGPYVLLSNMYAELGQWGNVMNVRRSMRKEGVTKEPGCSWIDVQGHVQVFMVKDKRHPRRNMIRSVLDVIKAEMKHEQDHVDLFI